jgi:acyl-CoA dehydrogenase
MGGMGQKEIGMAKVHVAGTLHKAAVTAVQLLGARGYSKDSVAEWIYRYDRAARRIDSASVHQMLLATLRQGRRSLLALGIGVNRSTELA